MAYTLVSAAALGFDLVRVPGGPNVAEVLLHALDADAAGLQQLANSHPGACRDRCWDAVREHADVRPTTQAVLRRLPAELDLTSAEGERRDEDLLTRLTGAPLGNLDALDPLVRRDVLDWTWEPAGEVSLQRLRDRLAADVLVDAAASAYCADLLDDRLRRHLAAPYLAAVRERAPVDESSLVGDLVARVLAEVSTWTAADRRDWSAAVDLLRSGTGAWTAAMHDAGWAAHLSGRTRTAATAQLRGVMAFRHAGFTATDAAQGAWNAFSGVLQALTVSDLLGDDETATLLAPWDLSRGTRPGSSGGRGPGR
jgi:hypothetical protein